MNNSVIYAQVDGFLSSVSEEYRSKIPQKLRNLFIEKKDKNIDIKYDLNHNLLDQNLSKEALSIIALLHLNYWCKTEQEQAELMKVFNDNTNRKEEEKRQKYNPDNIFQKKEIKEEVDIDMNTQIIQYHESFWQKCISWIKKLFQKEKK